MPLRGKLRLRFGIAICVVSRWPYLQGHFAESSCDNAFGGGPSNNESLSEGVVGVAVFAAESRDVCTRLPQRRFDIFAVEVFLFGV